MHVIFFIKICIKLEANLLNDQNNAIFLFFRMGNKFNLDLNYYRKSPDLVHRQSTEYDLLNGDGQDF